MPRIFVPEARPGWQRAAQSESNNKNRSHTKPGPVAKRSHVAYHRQSNGKFDARVTAMDSLCNLSEQPKSDLDVMPEEIMVVPREDHEALNDLLQQKETALKESIKLVAELRDLLRQRERELVCCQVQLRERDKEATGLKEKLEEEYESTTNQLQGRVEELELLLAQAISETSSDDKIHGLEAENATLKQEMEKRKEHSMTILNLISGYEKKLEEARTIIASKTEELKNAHLDNERPAAAFAAPTETGTPRRQNFQQPTKQWTNSTHVAGHKSVDTLSGQARWAQSKSLPSWSTEKRKQMKATNMSPVFSPRPNALPAALAEKSVAAVGKMTRSEKTKYYSSSDPDKKRPALKEPPYNLAIKRHSAEDRSLYEDNSEHCLDAVTSSSSRQITQHRSSPAKGRSPSTPVDSLASVGAPHYMNCRPLSRKKRSLSIEFASENEDS